MTQYINKDTLVAEIKERIKTYNKGYANGDDRRADALEVLLHDIDTLEVKEMESEDGNTKTMTLNRTKILEKEVADLKVPESRQNRHLRDELHKVRLGCQQAWEKANKEMAEKEKIQKQLSDYNQQFVIGAKQRIF